MDGFLNSEYGSGFDSTVVHLKHHPCTSKTPNSLMLDLSKWLNDKKQASYNLY